MFRSCPSSMASWWATLWSVGVLVLSGCATGAKKPDMSILDLAYDVVLTSVPIAGVAIHAASGKPAVQTGAGFRSTTQNFCPANGGSLVRAREQFVDLCRVKGGAFDGTFCTRGVGEVPFMAKIASTGSGGCVVLTVAEPAQAADSADYITHLATHGYQTVAARQQTSAARAAEALREADEARARAAARAEIDQRRLAVELPRLKKRGTLVCTDDGRQTFVGYVEDFTDEKLKVLVSKGFLTRAPSVAVRIEPGTLRWDEFAIWRLC